MIFDDDIQSADTKYIQQHTAKNQGSNNPMYGKRQSDETKKKISDSQRKRYDSIRKAVREQEENEQQAMILTKERICKSIKQIVDELMNEGR